MSTSKIAFVVYSFFNYFSKMGLKIEPIYVVQCQHSPAWNPEWQDLSKHTDLKEAAMEIIMLRGKCGDSNCEYRLLLLGELI